MLLLSATVVLAAATFITLAAMQPEKSPATTAIKNETRQSDPDLDDITGGLLTTLNPPRLKKVKTEYCIYKIIYIGKDRTADCPDYYQVGKEICVPCPNDKKCADLTIRRIFLNNKFICSLGLELKDAGSSCQSCPEGHIVTRNRE